MRPPESFVGQPIRSLQTMLRVIAEYDSCHSQIIPDGIYGPETINAITTFQKIHGLPTTGITDNQTWDSIVEFYEEAMIDVQSPHPLFAVMDPGQVIRTGQQHPHVHLIQAMLTVLAEQYKSISEPSFTGILDNATVDALASFQLLNDLPMTGHLDKKTWKHLVLQYPLAASLSNQ